MKQREKDAYRTAAREQYEDGYTIAIDIDAAVKPADDGGAWVAAWIYIEAPADSDSDE